MAANIAIIYCSIVEFISCTERLINKSFISRSTSYYSNFNLPITIWHLQFNKFAASFSVMLDWATSLAQNFDCSEFTSDIGAIFCRPIILTEILTNLLGPFP